MDHKKEIQENVLNQKIFLHLCDLHHNCPVYDTNDHSTHTYYNGFIRNLINETNFT